MPFMLNLNTIDTLFFRNNRSFSAGNPTLAESLSPSLLSIYGAIGQYLLNEYNIPFSDYRKNQFNSDNTKIDKIGRYEPDIRSTKFKLKGFVYNYRDKYYFPPPANIFENGKKIISIPQPTNDYKWDITNENLIRVKKPKSKGLLNEEPKPMKSFISFNVIKKYLQNSVIPSEKKDEKEFFEKETKFGHVLSPKTLSVEEQYLYSSTHLRFKETGILGKYNKVKITVFVEGPDISDFRIGTMFLGGEKKQVYLDVKDDFNKTFYFEDEILTKIKNQKKFFLYFITPSIFTNGWNREWDSIDEFKGSVLVGAAINKPETISGWKREGKKLGSAKGYPRPIRLVVPAGSVYFFDTQNWNDDKFKNLYKKFNLGESVSEEYPAAGFGTALIGSW